MVAPVSSTHRPASTPSMRRAHQVVAKTLLPAPVPPRETAPPVIAWKAWALTAWIVAVATAGIAIVVQWM